MRVLFLATDWKDTLGGIAAFNRTLSRALVELGADVHILALHDRGSDKQAGVESRGFRGQRLAFAAAAWKEARTADVILFGHLHFAPLALMGSRARKVLVVHGIEAWERASSLRRRGLAAMDEIVSVSEFTKWELIRTNGIPAEKVVVIPNTLPPDLATMALSSNRKRLGLPDGPMALAVSRLSAEDAYKQIDLLIECWPRILGRVPNAFLTVVGDGHDRHRLEAMATRFGVAGSIRFAGSVSDEDLVGYYRACDVFVLPSLREGFGIVFLEAMFFGKPCIGARAGGVPEVIEHNASGVLLDLDSSDRFVNALVSLLRDEEKAKGMGEAGRQRFENLFSFPSFKSRWSERLQWPARTPDREAA